MRYDLHTHSRHSDGALSPADVVAAAAAAGLDGIALTDHDCTDGYEEAVAAGRAAGVEVLLGCELSSKSGGASVHMLAYLVDPSNERWTNELRWMRDARAASAEAMVAKLVDLGVDVSMEQVRRIAGEGSIGRPHIAAAMVEAGVISTTPEAFTQDWIDHGGRAWVGRNEVSPADAVALTTQAGGVAVMAHPIWVERDLGHSAFEETFAACVEAGMAGLEVHHPDHDPATRKRFAALADAHGLIHTASSDFHGNAHGGPIGANTAGEEVVTALRERAAATQGV